MYCTMSWIELAVPRIKRKGSVPPEPRRCAVSHKSGNHRAATQLPQILQWRILWRAVYDLLAGWEQWLRCWTCSCLTTPWHSHHVGVTNVAVKVWPKVAKDQQNCLTANMCHGWRLNLRLSDYEKSVLTSRPERCAIPRKSGNHRATFWSMPFKLSSSANSET